MSIITLNFPQFGGGISSNSASGLEDSARFIRGLSVYDDDDSISLNPKPVKDSGSVVTDLVKHIVDATPYNTNRYAYGDSGNIYKISSNTWTLDRAVSTGGAAGQGLCVLNDVLLYTTSTTLGELKYLSNSPSYTDDAITDGSRNVDLSVTASGQTYTTPTSIAETAANKISITPTKDPLKALLLTFTAKGTGNVTITIHDTSNNTIGSVTVANASLSVGSNTFTFSTPLRIKIGKVYHVHVTSTVADTTVQTGTTADLSTAQYSTLFGIVVADTEYHPIAIFTDGTKGIAVIGNEQYLATYDLTTYQPNAIVIEPGYKVRGFTYENEFIVAYAWKGTNIDSFETGKMFYWDGITPYYNFSKPIPDGTPNSMLSSKNRMFSILGSSGQMFLGTEPFKKIQPISKLTKGSKIEVLPNATSLWQSRVLVGFSNTDDANAGAYNYSTGAAPSGVEQGVYEFGNQSDRAMSYTSVSTEVLNFSYQPSTSIANPLSFKIGCVEAFGKDVYISYKDASTYYVDRVNKSNGPQSNGSWESLVIDKGVNGKNLESMPQKTKAAVKLVISYTTLPTGCTITPKYKLERTANWTLGTAAVSGTRRAELIFPVGAVRYREIEIGYDVAATVNFPLITGVSYQFDPLQEEVNES